MSHFLCPGSCGLAGNKILCLDITSNGAGTELIPFSALTVYRFQNLGGTVILYLSRDSAGCIGLCADIY